MFPVKQNISPSTTRELCAEKLTDEVGMEGILARTVAGLSSVLVKEGLFNDTPPPLLAVPEAVLHRIHRRAASARIVIVIEHPEGISNGRHCVSV
jgi:hypothetical protein